MSYAEITSRLEKINDQSYPLTLPEEDAEAIVGCISRIMEYVSDDDKPFVAADYSLATSALCHPVSDEHGNRNARVK